jgi:hypothetical protein
LWELCYLHVAPRGWQKSQFLEKVLFKKIVKVWRSKFQKLY